MPCEVEFNTEEQDLPHENTMDLLAYREGQLQDRIRVMSTGGGRIQVVGSDLGEAPQVYALSSFREIAEVCRKTDRRLWQYALEVEGEGLVSYMEDIWQAMKEAVRRGLEDKGILPGGLQVVNEGKAALRAAAHR